MFYLATVSTTEEEHMKRTIATIGLLTLLACDGVQGEEGADQASTAAQASAATTEAVEAPRLGSGAALPPGLLGPGGLRPAQWGGDVPMPETLTDNAGGLRGSSTRG